MAANPKEPRHYYSLDEYFALEHAGDARYEYWDGDIFCMSGGTREHGEITSNVLFRLRLGVQGGPCRMFTGATAIKTPSVLPYKYPDASVGCGRLQFEKIRGVDALVNPVLIVEVLSPSTSQRDREEKFTAYKVIDSFRDYLLISQDTPKVTHYFKTPSDKWEREDVSDPEAVLKLDSISISLCLRDIYEDVEFGAN